MKAFLAIDSDVLVSTVRLINCNCVYVYNALIGAPMVPVGPSVHNTM